MQQCLALVNLYPLGESSAAQCWLSIKKLLRIWYRPQPTLHSAAKAQFAAQTFTVVPLISNNSCPMIYYCIVHALLKCSAYCSKSGKGKNWRERNIVRHTLEWMSGVFPIRFSMQWVHLYRTWSFDWAAVVVVGTIYHLLLRCHPL